MLSMVGDTDCGDFQVNTTIIADYLAGFMSGFTGNDFIIGNAGDDSIVGGDGDDALIGGSGHDVVLGRAGADRVVGNSGRDTLAGGSGSGPDPGDTVVGTSRYQLTGDQVIVEPSLSLSRPEPRQTFLFDPASDTLHRKEPKPLLTFKRCPDRELNTKWR